MIMVAFVLSSQLMFCFALVVHFGEWRKDFFALAISSIHTKRKSTWQVMKTHWCKNSGIGWSYWQVILGRTLTGCGASGIVSLASVIITGKECFVLDSSCFFFWLPNVFHAHNRFLPDIVEPSDVAVFRSYVNIASTVGISLGGPFGSFLGETVGWRWQVTFPKMFSNYY